MLYSLMSPIRISSGHVCGRGGEVGQRQANKLQSKGDHRTLQKNAQHSAMSFFSVLSYGKIVLPQFLY